MSHRFYPIFSISVGLAAVALAIMPFWNGCQPADRTSTAVRVSQSRRLMGVPWTITLYAATADKAHAAVDAAFDEVARLEAILSDYAPESELSRLSAAAPTVSPHPVSDDLWRVLDRSVEMCKASGGAFDVTVGPLTTLWRQSRRSGVLPRPDKLTIARAAVGPSTLDLLAQPRAVVLRESGMRLDLGGIGMGYAVDRALEVLSGCGIPAAMVDASGDIGVSGPPPGTAGWKIAVPGLHGTSLQTGTDSTLQIKTLLLVDAAVTTSGDAFQAVEIGGTRYSHIVDPRTGLGVAGLSAVTVIAADCATADAWATAASVLGHQRGMSAIEATPDCAAIFFWQEDGKLCEARSSRWPVR